MRKTITVASMLLALGLLTSCDETVLTAPPPCASTSGGKWEFLGLQDDTLAYVRVVTTDPLDPTRILAGTAFDFVGGLPGRLFLSEDNGLSWQQVLLSGRHFVGVLFDPTDSSVAYAATSWTIYKSTDGGKTWASSSADICTDAEAFIQMLKYSPDGALYTGVIDINSPCATTLYRSTDGAQSWEDLCEGQGNECLPNGPTAFGVDPVDPLRLFAGLNWTTDIHITADGGETWTVSDYAEGLTQEFVVDIVNSQQSFVSHSGGGASQSLDGGNTWEAFNQGLPAETNGNSLLQDMQTQRLYLLESFGPIGSLWWRESGASSWTKHPIAGEELRSSGALHLSDDRFLYVGSNGLWRREVDTITAKEPGPCGT